MGRSAQRTAPVEQTLTWAVAIGFRWRDESRSAHRTALLCTAHRCARNGCLQGTNMPESVGLPARQVCQPLGEVVT